MTRAVPAVVPLLFQSSYPLPSRAEGDAAVDHLLATALHFWVAALHGVKVEGFGLRASADGGGCAAAEADFHGRAAEL